MDKMKSLFLSSLLVVVSTSGLAQNPIIQTNYTADPAPMVYNLSLIHISEPTRP